MTQPSGFLTSLVAVAPDLYRTVPLSNFVEINPDSALANRIGDVGNQDLTALRYSKIKIFNLVQLLTSNGTFIGRSETDMSDIFEIGTVDAEGDSVGQYQYYGGLLYIRRDGSGLLVNGESLLPFDGKLIRVPGDQIDVPYQIIKCQREFGLTREGDLVQFTSDQSNYQPGLVHDEPIVDFAVTMANGADNRTLVILLPQGDVHLVECQIIDRVATVISVTQLPYINVVSVYSHWRMPYIIMLDRAGDVLVHDLTQQTIPQGLALKGRNINALSELGNFPLTANRVQQEGAPLAAAYSNRSSFVLRNFNPPRWVEVGRYKSLAAAAEDSPDTLYGLRV